VLGAASLALVFIGLVAVSGVLAVRDALQLWPQSRETFDGFWGQDTLIGRAVIRWETYGAVRFDPLLSHSPLLVEGVRRFGLDPDAPALEIFAAASHRSFRVVAAGAQSEPEERTVERVQDSWGRTWAIVLGRRRNQ